MSLPTYCACCSESLPAGSAYREGMAFYCRDCGDPSALGIYVTSADGSWEHASAIRDFDTAAGLAVVRSASQGQAVHVDVCCSTRAAAHHMGVLEAYDEDPDASVTWRLIVRAEGAGRVA